MRVQIVTSRWIGRRCKELAAQLLPDGWELEPYSDIPLNRSYQQPDVIISVLYGKVIKDFHPKTRYYNFHPGILPQYAGSATLSWSILNGEREAGCTLHELVREVDGGNIIQIRKFPLMPWDTAQSAAAKFTEVAEWMFVDWFKVLLDGDIDTTPQDKTLRRNYKRAEIRKELDLTRRIRAFTFEGKDEPYFVTRDGQKFTLSFDRGVIIPKPQHNETLE